MRKTVILMLALLPVIPRAGHGAESLGRIAFVGDSISAGVGARGRTHRYSTVAVRRLREKHPNVQEINLAQSGRALCQQQPTHARDILRREPDALVIQWGVNDQYWGYSVAEFVARYDQLVQQIRAAKPKMPIVLTTLVADFRWPENMDLWIGRANVAIQEIAARYRCRVAYIHRALDHDRSFYADSIHPNNAGAEAMAKAVVAAFNAPPSSPEKIALQFDQGREVRFLRYVFIPQRVGMEPEWVRITNLTKDGLQIETETPVTIRTPAIYARGKEYRVTVREPGGKEARSFELSVNWNRMLQFTIDPTGLQVPLGVTVAPVEVLER